LKVVQGHLVMIGSKSGVSIWNRSRSRLVDGSRNRTFWRFDGGT